MSPPALARSALVLGFLLGRSAAADGVSTRAAVARAGGGQLALAVGFDAAGQLHARVCTGDACTTDGAPPIEVPPEAARLATKAELAVVRVGEERKAILVRIPDAAAGRSWMALVVSPLSGSEPLVPFRGYTGLVDGVEEERSGPSILVQGDAVYVGTVREGRDLCGRAALLSPQVLDPATLTLKPAKLQRLPEAEREHAAPVAAHLVETEPTPALLQGAWATSAREGTSVAGLTDGKLETAWAEGRGGTGRGEAVVLRAPREVPLGAFEIVLPAAKVEGPRAKDGSSSRTGSGSATPSDLVPPKELWLATDHELYRVTLPDDARKSPSGRYRIPLPSPVHTSCVALVVESAFSDAKDAAVGVAEVSARPAEGASVDALVQKLADPGPDGDSAAAILRASGPSAFSAVALSWGGLAAEGQRRALDVLDEAPCDAALPTYVTALAGSEALRAHVRAALGRCGTDGPALIAQTLRERDLATRLVLAEELVSLSPGAAVDALVPLLSQAGRKERRAYRALLGRAAQAPDGHTALLRTLERTDLPRVAALDVLRAPGSLLSTFGDAAPHALARLSTDDASFRTRFLLLAPAAELAAADGAARTFLRHALVRDRSPLIRAEAVRALQDPRPFHAELSLALGDADVRVREAAALALGEGRLDAAADRLVQRFREDPWPLVRSAAGHALGALGPSPAIDAALTHAIEYDESPEVRREALLGVGVRGVTSAAGLARERLGDRVETDSVRAAAALSLGLMCDGGSADPLTHAALRLVSPTAEEGERRIGEAALSALSALKPRDLPERIAKLSDKSAPGPIRRLAVRALSAKGRCVASPPRDAHR